MTLTRWRRATTLLPHALTGVRLLCAPLLFFLMAKSDWQGASLCLLVAMITDVADGPLARRLDADSRFGAYFDVWADFAIIFVAFAGFAFMGIGPVWLPGLITLTFGLFVVSSQFTPSIYDPVGRYIGAILFAAALGTMIVADFLFQQVMMMMAAGCLAFTLGGRFVFVVATIYNGRDQVET